MTGPPTPVPGLPPRLLLPAIGVLGAAAVLAQLILLRELLGTFSGNELVLGLAFGLWLLLTGIGTRLATWLPPARSPELWFAAGLLGVAALPLLQVLALRGGRELLVPPGAVASLGTTTLGCALLLLPFCLVSGALLTLASAALARTAPGAAVGRVYIADTVGSLIGGALFSFALAGRGDHFVLLGVPALAAAGTAAALAARLHARALLISAVITTGALGAALIWGDLDARSAQWRHRGEIVYRATSPYGRLVVTRDAGQLTFFENGVPFLHSDNQAATEEAAHYAMAQRPAARQVLLIGGAVAGTAREILRHAVAEITCLELDPGVIAAGRLLLPANLADPRLTLLAEDGRRFLQRTPRRFDVIILDLPDPSTLQLNRYFTTEFFRAARRALAPDGVIAFGLGRYANYISAELALLLASAHDTLRAEFAHVRLIPGGRVFFLGSAAPLHLDIAARLQAKGIATQWVNAHFLAATLAPDRQADLARAVAQPAARNTDFAPVLYFYHLRHWLGQFATASPVLGYVVLALLAVYLVRVRAATRVIFAAGFAASALQLIVLLAFQVFYGALYQQIGLVVTVFMAGLAGGALATTRLPAGPRPGRLLATLGFAIAALAFALPFLLAPWGRLESTLGSAWAGQLAILSYSFVLAALIGAQIPLAGAADPAEAHRAAARLFSADLLGAALGALLVSAWLIPLLGVTHVCLLTAGLNAASAALAWRSDRPA